MSDQKMSRMALTAMVVGGMVGAGIFSLPQRFGNVTGPIGAIIAWAVAGAGMYMLARVFQYLAERKPNLDSGVFAYAKDGFGDFPGFLSAWGYWVGSCIGNVFYWVMISGTLSRFFPIFGEGGNSAFAIGMASIGIWAFHFMVLRGIQQAAAINKIVTIGKVIPILTFVAIVIFAFKADIFSYNLYGGDLTSGVFEQVRATMIVTVFVFLGIEGASVYSRYAEKRADVGYATIMGFVMVTTLMVLVTLAPFGVLERSEIAGVSQPSMAGVLAAVVGDWGAVFISIGVLVSVLGAYLAWLMICAEVMFAAAKNKDMPAVFAKENKNKVPSSALWASSIVIQLFVISTFWSTDAFNLMLDLTAAVTLIPFFLVAAYAFKLTRRGETYDQQPKERKRDFAVAIIATLYTAFLIFAAGWTLVLLSTVLYAVGIPLYARARREQGKPVFANTAEWTIFGLILVLGMYSVYGLATGSITI